MALCRLLLSRPDLLLLDEPTNHLDAESVAWLERFLRDYAGTVVAITHDRYFLDNVAGWILELDRGRGFPFEGNYSGWLEQKQARLDQEEKADSARQRTLERELEWVRMAPKARQAKGKARLAAYEKLLAEAEAAERGPDRLQILIPPGPALGDQVIEVDAPVQGLRRPAADRRPVVLAAPGRHRRRHRPQRRRQDHAVPHAHRRRGSPTPARSRSARSVELAYVDQSRDALDADNTVYEEITGGQDLLEVGSREVNGRAYVASFNFKGSDQQKKVGVLSGGERNRVHLAKMLRTGGNVLLLDEPTNDLDVDTLRALEDGARGVPRLRRGHQPRPLVPRPHRHPRPRLRGRQPGAVVRGQLQRVRGLAPQGAGRRGRPAPPHQVQAAGPLSRRQSPGYDGSGRRRATRPLTGG